MKTRIFTLAAFCFAFLASFSQTSDTVIFTTLGHFYYNTFPAWSAYSPLIDRAGRNYVYTASIDLGEVTFDISNVMNPHPVDTISPAMLNNTKATFLAQEADTLFISTGGFQVSGERAGLSIYDITNPLAPVLMDHWDSAAYTHGTAHIVVQGNYAYLAAMDDGIIILDVSDKHNIRFVSRFVPTTTPNTGYTPHSRGLFISHDTLLDADDGGGLRIISVVNKQNPVQMGAYLNPVPYTTDTLYPFYNHIWRIGDHAYIPVDYAGFEVDNVANPSSVTTDSWWNIWNNHNNTTWNGSDGHPNEIVSAWPTANVLMVSGGDSQVLAFDPTNPSQQRIMGAWGPPNTDSLAAWGIDVFGNLVVSGYIHSNFPYISKYGGIQLLSWNLVTGLKDDAVKISDLKIFPNPCSNKCSIVLPATTDEKFAIEIIDALGRTVKSFPADPRVNGRNAEIDTTDISAGIYVVRVRGNNSVYSARLVKE